MTVQDLGDTLTRLVELLRAADAKANTLKELNEFVESTADFGDLTLKAFVKLAEAGRTPPKQPAARTTAAKASVDPSAVTQALASLYQRAADPSVTEEQIRTACGQLKSLKKNALAQVAAGIGLEGMRAKKNEDIIAAITNRMLDRKGSAIRSQLIGRPSTPDSNAPVGGVASTP